MRQRVPRVPLVSLFGTRSQRDPSLCGTRVPVPVSIGHGDTVHTVSSPTLLKPAPKAGSCPGRVPFLVMQ